MSKQTVMHFINGPLDGTRTKAEGEPPSIWRTIGTMFISIADMKQLDDNVVPNHWGDMIHRYRLIYVEGIDYIYIHEGQESR